MQVQAVASIAVCWVNLCRLALTRTKMGSTIDVYEALDASCSQSCLCDTLLHNLFCHLLALAVRTYGTAESASSAQAQSESNTPCVQPQADEMPVLVAQFTHDLCTLDVLQVRCQSLMLLCNWILLMLCRPPTRRCVTCTWGSSQKQSACWRLAWA